MHTLDEKIYSLMDVRNENWHQLEISSPLSQWGNSFFEQTLSACTTVLH
jgi:hypothetical protein